MTSRASEHTFNDLVMAVVGADDPTLLQRACAALSTLLTEDPDGGDVGG